MTKKAKDQEARIRQIVLATLKEAGLLPVGKKAAEGDLPHDRDVRNIKLQRMKHKEAQVLDFKLKKPRDKWELIKALQEEFDKFPDHTEFTSFRAFGIGIGLSSHL